MLTKMENKFQFFNKTGQRGIPTKSFRIPGQQVEKRYCPVQNGTSGHFIQGPLNTNKNVNPAVHSLNILPTKFGNPTVNSFPSKLAQVAKVYL